MDRAIAAENGCVIWLESEGHCKAFTMRCRTLKKLERQRSRDMHADEPSHPMYDKSPWDEILFKTTCNVDSRWGVKALHDKTRILDLLNYDVEDL